MLFKATIFLGVMWVGILHAFATPTWQCHSSAPKTQYPVKNFYESLLKIETHIEKGYSLASKLIRYKGLKQSEFYTLFSSLENKKLLRRVKAGAKIVIYLAKDSCHFIEARISLAGQKELRISKQEGKLIKHIYQLPIEYRNIYKQFHIESSMFADGNKVGITDRVLSNIENLLAGRVNFSRVLSQGDRFQVLYEQLYDYQGNFLRSGDILFLEYQRKNGKNYQVGNYLSTQGRFCYLDEKKQSIESLFIRNPVKYTRVSSQFSLRRKHPILNVIKSHKGVDFAAPLGTPVRSVATGRVKKKYYSKTYGNVIFIQHGKHYTTVYAHLHRFARGLKKGDKVDRAEVIGYVGSTGLSTGPHLHYEFRIDGKHYNPLTVNLPHSVADSDCHVNDESYKRQLDILKRQVAYYQQDDDGSVIDALSQ